MKPRLTWMLEKTGIADQRWRTRPNALYTFAFHRIGNSRRDEFHPNIFSCTESNLSTIVRFIGEHFDIVRLGDVIQLARNDWTPKGRYALLTFDDGYVDNYTAALPVLQAHRVSAVFFVSSRLANTLAMPWWDEVAWIISRTTRRSLVVTDGDRRVTLDLARHPRHVSIRTALGALKRKGSYSMEDRVEFIRQQIDDGEMQRHALPTQLFMSWDQIRALSKAGMDIGSHAETHRILSHLSEPEQATELTQSKHQIEKQIGGPVSAVAYPVGSKTAFNARIAELAKLAGYAIGFSFVPGINIRPTDQRFSLSRLSIDGNPDVGALKTRIALAPRV